MCNVKFIVWVGGVAEYEGFDPIMARLVEQSWLDQNYDDVILETVRA